ncbi:MAG: hypothetical protein QHH75_05795, partial [Bacillota bacterium]|nr:hypothetical protein [Bacillota bacterium]
LLLKNSGVWCLLFTPKLKKAYSAKSLSSNYLYSFFLFLPFGSKREGISSLPTGAFSRSF